MPITRKPTSNPDLRNKQEAIDSIIQKGGSVAGEEQQMKYSVKVKNNHPVILRVPSFLLDQIDEILLKLPLKKTRHAWFLEALLEKAEKDRKEK